MKSCSIEPKPCSVRCVRPARATAYSSPDREAARIVWPTVSKIIGTIVRWRAKFSTRCRRRNRRTSERRNHANGTKSKVKTIHWMRCRCQATGLRESVVALPPGFGAFACRCGLWVGRSGRCFTTTPHDCPSGRSQDRPDGREHREPDVSARKRRARSFSPLSTRGKNSAG